MSKGLKNQGRTPKIRKESSAQNSESCYAEQYPQVSFRYLTLNKNHNFHFIKDLDGLQKEVAYNGLLFYLQELTQRPWTYWHGLGKHAGGVETLPHKQLQFEPNEKTFSGDEKVIVLRFDTHMGRNKGRIIGFKDSPCSAFFVIGFDFDYSAYDHG